MSQKPIPRISSLARSAARLAKLTEIPIMPSSVILHEVSLVVRSAFLEYGDAVLEPLARRGIKVVPLTVSEGVYLCWNGSL